VVVLPDFDEVTSCAICESRFRQTVEATYLLLNKFVQAFSVSGFRGGLNYYRNLDRNREVQAAFEGLLIEVPALYLVGERDTGLAIPGMHEIIGAMPQIVPSLRASRVVPRAGHWLQQEAPDFVNSALIEFLREL